MLKDKKELL